MLCYVLCLDVRVFLFRTIVTRIMSEENISIYIFPGPSLGGGVVRGMLSESPGTPGQTLSRLFYFRVIVYYTCAGRL